MFTYPNQIKDEDMGPKPLSQGARQDPIKRTLLAWKTRYNIIKGIANILLDEEMNPKIAIFGVARLFKLEETHGDPTSRVVGTYGYMAPEYVLYGHFSVKSYVYSFGVLVLEMITGQENRLSHNGESLEDLLSFVWKSWRNGTSIDIIDPTLRTGRGFLADIIKSTHIGLLCV